MKKKLSLEKTTISRLSATEQSEIKGGRFTTSFGNCTGFTCCDEQPKITEAYTTCLSDGEPGRPDCEGYGY